MNGLLWLAVGVIVLAGVVSLLKGEGRKERRERQWNDHRRASYYKKRDSVLDKRELAFFLELTKQLPSGLRVFPKMRIADIVEVTNGKGYRGALYKILPKHVDFLITDQNFRPLCVVELNGSSHGRESVRNSDQLKQEIFKSANLRLHIIQVGHDFSSEVRRILVEQAITPGMVS